MGLRKCDKCSEMVAESKAFCPGCGNAFVEEERPKTTAFQKLDHTVQFGQTMYNQMLEDMGLNISDTPNHVEKLVEVITPIKTEISIPPIETNAGASAKPAEKNLDKPKTASNLKWYILGGLVVIILFPLALWSAILLILDIWSRLSR